MGRMNKIASPILTLDDATDQRHETDTDPEHDRSHLDGDVLLRSHGTGEPGLEQIGVDAVDVLGGVEPRQVVTKAL